MDLHDWSWLFLFFYILAMFGFGILGGRRVTGADDFATARGGYGPLLLALAFASTAASGRPRRACFPGSFVLHLDRARKKNGIKTFSLANEVLDTLCIRGFSFIVIHQTIFYSSENIRSIF
jgi:hypothetical protein